MVLEALLDPDSASDRPWTIIFLSFAFVAVAVYSARYLLRSSTSLLVVALVALPSVTLLANIFNRAAGEERGETRKGSVTRYFPILLTLGSYFVGVMAAFTFFYLLLPVSDRDALFSDQSSELLSIGSVASGRAVQTAFSGNLEAAFEFLFLNNLKVLLVLLGGSILYGTGTVFILDWNASVLGVFVGSLSEQLARSEPAKYTVWSGIGAGLVGLFPHGTFELFAYLCAALACGVLSAATLRRAYKDPEFLVVVFDVAKLASWSIILLAIGAFIEGLALAGLA